MKPARRVPRYRWDADVGSLAVARGYCCPRMIRRRFPIRILIRRPWHLKSWIAIRCLQRELPQRHPQRRHHRRGCSDLDFEPEKSIMRALRIFFGIAKVFIKSFTRARKAMMISSCFHNPSNDSETRPFLRRKKGSWLAGISYYAFVHLVDPLSP